MGKNHRWGEAVRPNHLVTLRTCVKCGIVKKTRHEGMEHWSEFYTREGGQIAFDDHTPPCSSDL